MLRLHSQHVYVPNQTLPTLGRPYAQPVHLPLRFVEEVREQQIEENEKETSSYAGQQASGKMRRCYSLILLLTLFLGMSFLNAILTDLHSCHLG